MAKVDARPAWRIGLQILARNELCEKYRHLVGPQLCVVFLGRENGVDAGKVELGAGDIQLCYSLCQRCVLENIQRIQQKVKKKLSWNSTLLVI